jgi:hypothetical protein
VSNIELIGCDLIWRRNGAEWVLLRGRRRMGRVVPDSEHPGMYRVALSRGRLSGMAPCPGPRAPCFEAATRELEWEVHHRPVIDPPKPQQIAPVFDSGPPGIRFPVTAGSTLPSSL